MMRCCYKLHRHYFRWHIEWTRVLFIARSESPIQIMRSIVFVRLTHLRRTALVLLFLPPSEGLEHPIVIVFTAILFIARAHRLYRSLKLILFSFLDFSEGSCLRLVVVRPRRGVALSRAHQPLIYFLVSFKYALIIWSSIIRPQGSFLSNHEIYLCHNRAVPSRVFSRG